MHLPFFSAYDAVGDRVMKCLGILCRREILENKERCFLPATLVDRLSALALQLHPIVTTAHAKEEAALCDGLLLSGGIDALPCYYDQAADVFSSYYSGFQDLDELLLIDAFIKQRRPILGICRGMQMLQLYFHGSLEPAFDVFAHARDHQHPLQFAKNTYLHTLYPQEIAVNSHHHQRIVRPAKGLVVDAFCTDGTIEAFHHRELPIYGVQWHPELLAHDRVLPYFLSIVCGIITPFDPADDSPQ